ncbi:hypothetical protein G6F31_016664 [Rhizopus arrhizus]|nr:hypothetical protein G6F31_016664 [Rhizopus arrhizus]
MCTVARGDHPAAGTAGAGRGRGDDRQAAGGVAAQRPRTGAAGCGAQCTGGGGDLVPGHADRPCRGRCAVRRLQPVRPPAGQLPAGVRPAAVLLQPPAYRPSGTADHVGVQGALARDSERAAVSVRPRHRLHLVRLRRAAAECRPAGLGRDPDAHHHADQQRCCGGRGSGAAVHPRPRGQPRAPGA